MARTEKTHPLFHWRKANGNISLQKLAGNIGCTQSFLSQIEAYQKQPSLKTAMLLREETGLALEDFVKQTEPVQ
jgi:transcriptional regulator with XRE-family HTH domain